MLTLQMRALADDEQAERERAASKEALTALPEKARMHMRIALQHEDAAKIKRQKQATLSELYKVIENARDNYQLYSMPELIRAAPELRQRQEELDLIQMEEAMGIDFPDVPVGLPQPAPPAPSSAHKNKHRSSAGEGALLPLLM